MLRQKQKCCSRTHKSALARQWASTLPKFSGRILPVMRVDELRTPFDIEEHDSAIATALARRAENTPLSALPIAGWQFARLA